MYDGFLMLGGNEIINSARAAAYASRNGLTIHCEPCETLAAALGDDPYNFIDEDTPWWDANLPQSKGFLGVFGLDVAGFNTNPISRSPAELVGDGAVLGPLRRTHREISYTVALIATGECELSYGLEWLAAALLGSTCGQMGCSGDEMCVLACCPGESPAPRGGELGDAEMRHLYDVGLLEGPSVTEKKYLNGGAIIWATVTFTLGAAKPWIYREPLITLSDWVQLGEGEVVPNVDPDAVYGKCPDPRPCLEDPTCPAPPLPPRPPIPLSPCYPTGLGTFRRTRIQVSALDQPTWLETVPMLEVQAGDTSIRRLLVRFWTNPQNNPCEEMNDPCNACTDITIAYLPQGANLRVDGRVERAVVECPQVPIGTALATPTIYGPQGAAFQWPTFTCPTGLCIEVWSLAETTAPDAAARVLMVPRADMG